MKKLKKNEIIMMSAIFVLGVVFFISKKPSSQSFGPDISMMPGDSMMLKQGFSSNATSNDYDSELLIKEYAYIVDPFKKVNKVESRVVNQGPLKLEGIVWDDNKPLVAINGEVLAVGDNIDGYEVKIINKQGVELDKDGVMHNLVLPQDGTP